MQPQWPRQKPCPIALVGDFPDDHSIQKHMPIAGPRGRILAQALRVAGIEQQDCLVTNVFDAQPPKGKLKEWCAGAAVAKSWEGYAFGPIGDLGYLRPEYGYHLGRLAREIAAAKPVLVVPLGAVALWAFSGSAGISERRGSTFEATLLAPGKKLLPTWDPKTIQGDWSCFHIACGDLVKARRESQFPEVRHTPMELWLEPSLADMARFKEEYLDHADIISLDIETAGGQITCVGFAADATRAITVPFSDPRRADRSYWHTAADEASAWEWVRTVCANGTPKLLQNGLYDAYWLWLERGIPVMNYRHDTRLLHHALYPELPKSLAFLGATYASRGPWKTMRMKRAEKRDE